MLTDDHGSCTLGTLGLVWHPVDLAQPDHAAPRGQHPSQPHAELAWKTELAALAAETGLAISVCHLPPGTSKWNKIEHRRFRRDIACRRRLARVRPG